MFLSFGRCFRSGLSRFTYTKQFTATRLSSTLSVLDGVKGPELLNKSFPQLIDDQNKIYPFKDLFRSPSDDILWDFKETLKYQDALGSGILETSIKGGTLVTALPLRFELMLAILGSLRANFPLAIVAPGAKAPELEKQLIATQPSVIFWSPKVNNQDLLDEIYTVFPNLSYDRESPINDRRVPLLRFIVHTARPILDGMCKVGDLLVFGENDALRKLLPKIDPKTPNITLLSPDYKGITLSQHNITNTGYLTGFQANLNEEDIVYTTLLLHNSYGLSLGLGMALTRKVKLVWGSELFDSAKVLSALSSEYCTTIVAQPSEYRILLEDIEKQKNKTFKALKKALVVSSPENLPTAELLEGIKKKFNTSVIVTFGTNETGGVVTTTAPDTPLMTNVVGKPLPHTQIQIVDKEGKPVPINTPGELIVKGFNITNGYKNDPTLTNQKIKNGFLYTNVTAKLDNDKNVVIV